MAINLVALGRGNRVFTVVTLIVAYVIGAVILVLLGLEFLAVALVIVYAGALSVFFLLVVMLVRERIVGIELNATSIINFVLLSFAFFIFIYAIGDHWSGAGVDIAADLPPVATTVVNVEDEQSLLDLGKTPLDQLSEKLYEDGADAFLGGGMVLLVAILGVIFITSLIPKIDKSRERGSDQLERSFIKDTGRGGMRPRGSLTTIKEKINGL